MEIIFLGGGFVVCFVLKAEKGKHINCYTLNDICSSVQMQGGFFLFHQVILQHCILNPFVIKFYSLSFSNKSIT